MSTGEETAASLVDQLAAAGDWPEPALCAAIVAKGSEAVAPLRALLQREPSFECGRGVAALAGWLLGDLGDRSAVPDLLNLFRRDDDEAVEAAKDSLRQIRTEVIEPLLAIGRDESLRWYPRIAAFETAIEQAGDDLPRRARIAEVMREILAECVNKSNDAHAREYDLASLLVCKLSELADPLARDLIDTAFRADLIEEFTIDRNDVDELYREGGEKSTIREPEPFLSWYQDRYKEHLESEQRIAAREEDERNRREEWERGRSSAPPASAAPPEPMFSPPPQEPIRNTTWRPRRNDPCWCGSGKKYKQCHLRHDEGQP
jgi:hypothetical protein